MYYSLQGNDHNRNINNEHNNRMQNRYIQEYEDNEHNTQSDTVNGNFLYALEAFVEAIIPRSLELAEEFGRIQYYGALDFQTDEYLLWNLKYYEKNNRTVLPKSFKSDSEYLVSVGYNLVNYTLMGYYSEWYGYGSTRLSSPNQRTLQFYPLSWQQIGYPGPSLGYRALRE